MELLFKRQQTSARFLKVAFKLWGKIDLNEDEQAIIQRYNFADFYLIEEIQPKLIRNSALIALAAWLVIYIILGLMIGANVALVLGLMAGIGVGYWWFHKHRETLYVKDLMHGRHFVCRSVIDLAKKEAWLEGQVSVLRQVMESAKHWDGTEKIDIPALPKEEAKQLMLQHT